MKSEAFLKSAVKDSMRQNKALTQASMRQKQQNEKLKAFLAKNNVPLTTGAASDYKSSRVVEVASDPNLTGRVETTKGDLSPKMQVALIEKAASQGEFPDKAVQDQDIITISKGEEQVDIKIPKTFLTQGTKNRDDLEDGWEGNQQLALP